MLQYLCPVVIVICRVKDFEEKGQMFVNSESLWGFSAPFSVETSFVDTLKGVEIVAEVAEASQKFLF